jgi:hypothetical protein
LTGDEAGVSADGGDPLLQAKGITVDFGDRRILECVDIAVRAGEIVTLIGPNGSGKTTLVRVVLGHLKPGAGAVRRRAGLTIGYLPQRFVFDTTLPLTVRGFLDLPKPRPEPRLREALAEVGVAETLNQAVQELSGGELQRLLLARALLRRAPAGGRFRWPDRPVPADRGGAQAARLWRAHGVPRPAPGHGRHRPGGVPEPPRLLFRGAGLGEPAP